MTKNIPLEDDRIKCPDCDRYAASTIVMLGNTWTREYYVRCKRCKAEGPRASTIDEAVRLWKERRSPDLA